MSCNARPSFPLSPTSPRAHQAQNNPSVLYYFEQNVELYVILKKRYSSICCRSEDGGRCMAFEIYHRNTK